MRSSGRARQAALLRSVGRTGTARLSGLAAELEVSIATVRRDVEDLARQGRLIRRHGVVELEDAGWGAAGRLRRQAPALGMMLPGNRYLRLIGQAARREAERRGFRFLLEQVETAEQSAAATRRLVAAGCVGLIHSPQWRTVAEMEQPHPWLLDSGVAVVLAGRDVEPGHPLFELDSVIADHGYGMRLAMEHLSALGHRRVLAAISPTTPPGRLLRQVFVAERRRLGLDRGPAPVPTPRADAPDRQAALVRILREQRATAVIVHTDTEAVALVRALLAAGSAVPEDCSVVAYDDIVGPQPEVTLTSISPPKHQLGVEAVSLLLRRHLRAQARLDPPPVAHVRLLAELVVRGSTGPAS